MGTASCAIWKSLLKHEREEKDQELWDLSPARSPKPPNHSCHFRFLFSKHLGCTCIIFLNFPLKPRRQEIPFLWNRLLCGPQHQSMLSCGPSPPRTCCPPPFCCCRLPGRAGAGGWGCAPLLAAEGPRSTWGLGSGLWAGFPLQSQPPIFTRLVRV